MSRLLSITLMAAMVAVSPPCFAQDDYGCAGPDTSTLFDACVNIKKAERLESAISQKLEELRKGAPSQATASEVSFSQKEWEKYRDRACNVQQALMSGMNSVNYARCASFLAQQRLDYLQSNY